MSLLDLASLVLAPTATKEGKVYSAIPDTGEGDMTFTRGSGATRINSAGLIEKERANLLVQSNTFDTTWVNNLGGAITGGQSGYDGSNDAWEINKNTTSFRRLEQTVSLTGIWTFSVYAKAGTREEMALRDGTSGDRAEFDLDSGTIVNNGGGTIIERNMTDVGGGWYRCSITCNSTNTLVQIYIDWNETIGGNIYIQDAQVEEGLVATDVIETTTSAVYEGITDDVPRVDYSGGGCPSLLLESQRTNLVTNSEYVSSSDYVTGNWTGTITTNTSETLSPEGLYNATKFVKSGSTDRVYFQTSVSDGTYTGSMYFKAVSGQEGNTVEISVRRFGGGSGATTKLITLTSEWQRVDVTATLSGGSNTAIYIADFSSSGNANSFYCYAVQLEAGSYVSSYIPTYSVSSTRVADSCSKTGISELIGQTEGTMFLDFIANETNDARVTLSDGSAANRLILRVHSAGKLQWQGIQSSTEEWNIETSSGQIASGNRYKIAAAYDTNNVTLYLNGTQLGSDTSATVANALSIFQFSSAVSTTLYTLVSNLSQAILFPTRLTNDQLEELTK